MVSRSICLATAILLALSLAGCESTTHTPSDGGDGKGTDASVDGDQNNESDATDSTSNVRGKAISLTPFSKRDDWTRTKRELFVSEVTPSGIKLISSFKESYTQRVRSVDALGRPLLVERFYELSRTSAMEPGRDAIIESTPREGAQLELSQGANGVSVRVMSGELGQADVQGLMITGFDVGLLPTRDVRVGETWEVDITANPALNALVESFGVAATTNELKARLLSHEAEVSRVSLNWRVVGKIAGGNPVVLVLVGELELDHTSGLIRKVSLSGGKTDEEDKVIPQIAMTIEREPISTWYD